MERAKTNPLAEPNQGERVPYLIGFNSEYPNANLIDCVWTLDNVLKLKSQFKLHSMYYIKKQILPDEKISIHLSVQSESSCRISADAG